MSSANLNQGVINPGLTSNKQRKRHHKCGNSPRNQTQRTVVWSSGWLWTKIPGTIKCTWFRSPLEIYDILRCLLASNPGRWWIGPLNPDPLTCEAASCAVFLKLQLKDVCNYKIWQWQEPATTDRNRLSLHADLLLVSRWTVAGGFKHYQHLPTISYGWNTNQCGTDMVLWSCCIGASQVDLEQGLPQQEDTTEARQMWTAWW